MIALVATFLDFGDRAGSDKALFFQENVAFYSPKKMKIYKLYESGNSSTTTAD